MQEATEDQIEMVWRRKRTGHPKDEYLQVEKAQCTDMAGALISLSWETRVQTKG